MVKRIKSLKIVTITIIFISLQLLDPTTAFANLPVTGSYAPPTNYTGIIHSLPEAFSAVGADKAGFDFVGEALVNLGERQNALYNEYLLLEDGTRVSEKAYVGKMRNTSRIFIGYLRKTLKNNKKSLFISDSSDGQPAFKALFLLDRNRVDLR
jgi:hypothetical protein